MRVRSTVGAVCASALATTALTPAVASAQGYGWGDDEVRVTVCKFVKDHDDKHKRFWFDAWTDEDEKDFSLRDRQCKRFYLDFDRNRLWLEEDVSSRWDVDFRVYGDYKRVREYDDAVRIKIDDREDDPRITILVINERDDHDHWDF